MLNKNNLVENNVIMGFEKILLKRLKEIEIPPGHQPYDNLQIQAMYHFAAYLNVVYPNLAKLLDENETTETETKIPTVKISQFNK